MVFKTVEKSKQRYVWVDMFGWEDLGRYHIKDNTHTEIGSRLPSVLPSGAHSSENAAFSEIDNTT